MATAARMNSAANMTSVSMRALALIMTKPRPEEAPTHSPMIAPMGAMAVATRRPEAKAGQGGGQPDMAHDGHGAGVHGAGKVQPAGIGAAQAVGEIGGDGEEDHQHGHDDFRAHAEAEPEHQQRGEGEDGDGLAEHQDRHQPALQQRGRRRWPNAATAPRSGAEGQAEQDFRQRGERVPEQQAVLGPERDGDRFAGSAA